MKEFNGSERPKLLDFLQRKGKEAALKDPKAGPQLSAADRLDVERKAFLSALADLCAAGFARGIPKEVIRECLEGALEGIDRV